MSDERAVDRELGELVRQACEETARGISREGASFEALWSRARAELSRRKERPRRMPRLGWVLAPAFAVAVIALVVRLPERGTGNPELASFASTTRLRLPSDSLLPEMGLIPAEYPSDSLRWRTE
jgi:hypothetical protein